MRIECLIKRDGITEFFLEKIRYSFQPNPFGRPGQFVTGIAEVQNEAHAKALLARPHFREYDKDRTMRETMGEAIPKNIMSGIEIRKYKDQGYVICDIPRKRFAGSDGEWKGTLDGMTPFPSEIAAYTWLQEAAAAGDFEDAGIKTIKKPKGTKKTDGEGEDGKGETDPPKE